MCTLLRIFRSTKRWSRPEIGGSPTPTGLLRGPWCCGTGSFARPRNF